MRIKYLSMIVLAAGMAVHAVAVHAVDGVFEISSDCRQFGCFPGDSAGGHIEITQPGSYRLTSNLDVNINTTAIEVNTGNVTIDLNGYSISGPVVCSGSDLSCSSSGIGDGIDAADQENITIRNGIVEGVGRDGIVVGRGAFLENLTVAECSDEGIVAETGPGSVLRRLVVRENGGMGVALGLAVNYIMDSVVFNNGNQGVFGGFCGNVLMSGNGSSGNSCIAIAPNRCDSPTDCD